MKYLTILLTLVVVSGCSSTSTRVVDNSVPYCNTSSKTVLDNGTTSSSQTVVECTDKPNPTAQFETSMAGNKCGWANQFYIIHGRKYMKQVMACQLQDGSWTYVTNPSSY